MSWELPLLTTLILSVIGFCWLRVCSPHSSLRAIFYFPAIACTLALVFDTRELLQYYPGHPTSIDNLLSFDFRPDALLTTHFKMALTLGAVVWYVFADLFFLVWVIPNISC